jgi:hypothetical protein
MAKVTEADYILEVNQSELDLIMFCLEQTKGTMQYISKNSDIYRDKLELVKQLIKDLK